MWGMGKINNMSKKTAISELIEYFEQQLRLHRSTEIKFTSEEALVDAISVCKNSVKIEKQQIEEAYRKGVIDERYDKLDFINKPYYNETYKS